MPITYSKFQEIHQQKRSKSVSQFQIRLFLTEKMEMEWKLSHKAQEQLFMYKMQETVHWELMDQTTSTLIFQVKEETLGFMNSQKTLCHHLPLMPKMQSKEIKEILVKVESMKKFTELHQLIPMSYQCQEEEDKHLTQDKDLIQNLMHKLNMINTKETLVKAELMKVYTLFHMKTLMYYHNQEEEEVLHMLEMDQVKNLIH